MTAYLYGTTGEWDKLNAADFLKRHNELASQYEDIESRVHSRGGSVFEGFAIYQGLKQSKARISIVIDGVLQQA